MEDRENIEKHCSTVVFPSHSVVENCKSVADIPPQEEKTTRRFWKPIVLRPKSCLLRMNR